MRIRTLAFAGLLALAAGCADEPYAHHAIATKVPNFDAAVDASATVLRRHYTKIESITGNSDEKIIRTGWQEKMEMNERERWQATATITRIDDVTANVDVVVMRQNDESDTGFGERSPSNPKWSVATHYAAEEQKILNEIEREIDAMRQ